MDHACLATKDKKKAERQHYCPQNHKQIYQCMPSGSVRCFYPLCEDCPCLFLRPRLHAVNKRIRRVCLSSSSVTQAGMPKIFADRRRLAPNSIGRTYAHTGTHPSFPITPRSWYLFRFDARHAFGPCNSNGKSVAVFSMPQPLFLRGGRIRSASSQCYSS